MLDLGRWRFPCRHGHICSNVLGAAASTPGGAAWKGIGHIGYIEWGVELIARSEEPASVAVKAAYMATTETGHQHSIYHFTTNDAGKFSRQWLSRFAIWTTAERRGTVMVLRWRIDCHRRRCKDGQLEGMATIGTVTLEVEAFKTRHSIAACGLGECSHLGAVTVAAPVLTRMHVLCIVGHSTNLEDFALLYGKLPDR
jgi:hypothetical protein